MQKQKKGSNQKPRFNWELLFKTLLSLFQLINFVIENLVQ